jgi:hypothetical protein
MGWLCNLGKYLGTRSKPEEHERAAEGLQKQKVSIAQNSRTMDASTSAAKQPLPPEPIINTPPLAQSSTLTSFLWNKNNTDAVKWILAKDPYLYHLTKGCFLFCTQIDTMKQNYDEMIEAVLALGLQEVVEEVHAEWLGLQPFRKTSYHPYHRWHMMIKDALQSLQNSRTQKEKQWACPTTPSPKRNLKTFSSPCPKETIDIIDLIKDTSPSPMTLISSPSRPTNPTLKHMRMKVCYYCYQIGHFTSYCSTFTCQYCHVTAPGHYANCCPERLAQLEEDTHYWPDDDGYHGFDGIAITNIMGEPIGNMWKTPMKQNFFQKQPLPPEISSMVSPYFSHSDLLFFLITCLVVSIIIGITYLLAQHFHKLCNYMHPREDFGTNSTVRFYHGTEDDEHEGDIPLINLFPLPPNTLHSSMGSMWICMDHTDSTQTRMEWEPLHADPCRSMQNGSHSAWIHMESEWLRTDHAESEWIHAESEWNPHRSSKKKKIEKKICMPHTVRSSCHDPDTQKKEPPLHLMQGEGEEGSPTNH